MKWYRYLLPIAVSLLLLCTMAGAVSADTNYVNATYVSASGTAYEGNYGTITNVSAVQSNGVMTSHTATYFAVFDGTLWNNISVTQDKQKITSHLPEQVGSSAILATSPAKGTTVASIPNLVLRTGDGGSVSGALGSVIEHTYLAEDTYSLTADILNVPNYFSTPNPYLIIPIAVSPSSVTVQEPRTTVNFYYNNGTDQYVEKVFIVGETPDAPAVPSYPNYNFQGWNLSLGDGAWKQLFNSANEPLEVSGYINDTKKWTNTSAGPLNVYAEWKLSEGMQLNLTADGIAFEEGKYWIAPGSTANVTVSLKYNLTKMGWDPAKTNPKVNTINITAVANFSVPENMRNVTFTPTSGVGTSGEMSGSSYKVYFTLGEAISLSGENEVTIGKLTLTAPANWGTWTIVNPFTITFDDALASNEEGALVKWDCSSISTPGIWQSIDAPENAFTLYPLDVTVPTITSVKYYDGRYVYEQGLDSSAAGPTFYLYNDIYNGGFSDAKNGNFTLTTNMDTILVKGFFWNTDNFGENFKFKNIETVGKTNYFNRSYFNPSMGVMNVSLNFTGVEQGKQNITVKVENYCQSYVNNSLSGWFFNTPYNVTINVRPGPAAINVSAGTVEWDSAIAYDEFKNNYASSTGYVWSGATSGNSNVAFKNNFVGGKNITVTKSDIALDGNNAIIILSGKPLGDVNKNGVVNLDDASKLGFIIEKDIGSGSGTYAAILSEAAFTGMTNDHVILLDCNKQGGDGKITVGDLQVMYKWLSHVYSGTPYSYEEWKSAA